MRNDLWKFAPRDDGTTAPIRHVILARQMFLQLRLPEGSHHGRPINNTLKQGSVLKRWQEIPSSWYCGVPKSALDENRLEVRKIRERFSGKEPRKPFRSGSHCIHVFFTVWQCALPTWCHEEPSFLPPPSRSKDVMVMFRRIIENIHVCIKMNDRNYHDKARRSFFSATNGTVTHLSYKHMLITLPCMYMTVDFGRQVPFSASWWSLAQKMRTTPELVQSAFSSFLRWKSWMSTDSAGWRAKRHVKWSPCLQYHAYNLRL
jgi:hypothetical protein